MTNAQVDELIQRFGFQRLEAEGGFFRATYRSKMQIAQGKPAASAILYLLTDEPDCFSALHRLPSDEVYHFYLGDPVMMLWLLPNGQSEHVILGHNVLAGEQIQVVVPLGVWQGTFLLPGGKYALMGTTMTPGFTESDYEGGEREALTAQYPHEAAMIRRLTRPNAPLRMHEPAAD